MLRIVLATLHLLALGIGLGAVLGRAAALREPIAAASVRRAFRADAAWGIAALIWIVTGLWRLFGETEKSIGYYFGNHVFLGKMGLLLVVLILEAWPALTLVRWRTAGRRAPLENIATPETARRIAIISDIQAALVIAMVVAAAMMARGVGARE